MQEIYNFHMIYRPKSTQFTINFLSEEATVWEEIWKAIPRESWHIKWLKDWYLGKLSSKTIQDSGLGISSGNSEKSMGNEKKYHVELLANKCRKTTSMQCNLQKDTKHNKGTST